MHGLRGRFPAAWLWCGLAAVMVMPVAMAIASPYLAYRDWVYILAGFSGILVLSLLVLQPLLGAGYLPGARGQRQRTWHQRTGTVIILCVVLHVGGLFVVSPPDTLDALLLVSPTPFSVYGVLAFWCVAMTALLVALRRRLGLRPLVWRILHNLLALIIVIATVIHALQIQGAMELLSKWFVCAAALITTGATLFHLRIFKALGRLQRHIPGK